MNLVSLDALPLPSVPLAQRGPGNPPEAPADAPGAEASEPVISSAALLQGRKLVQIEHNGARYMLRTTRLGKLILTK